MQLDPTKLEFSPRISCREKRKAAGGCQAEKEAISIRPTLKERQESKQMVSDGREYIFARTTQFGIYTSCFEPEPYVRTREIDELGAGGVLDDFVALLSEAA